MPDLPLAGLLVADFSRVLAGPYASMLLGDLGADVVKVERPDGGDDTRHWGPPWRDSEATYYLGLNRNKRSVALDLTEEGDRALARRLALRGDVLLESFRPGLMASWGLDGDTLRAAGNPRLVSCSVTAFGSGERARGMPGYDFLLQSMGGLMSVTGEADGRPLKVGAAVVDLVCGLLATIGVQAALVERERTGRGRHVEVSLMDSALACLLNQGSGWVLAGPAAAPWQPPSEHRPIRDLRDRRPPDRCGGRQRPAVRAAVRGGRRGGARGGRALRHQRRSRRQRRLAGRAPRGRVPRGTGRGLGRAPARGGGARGADPRRRGGGGARREARPPARGP